MIYIFWTCRDQTESKKISRELLDQRLIACASILPQVESIYRWNGNIEESQEVKIILKTVENHFDAIQHYIRKNCSYEVPEIIRVDIPEGNPRYIAWVTEETS